MDKRNKRGIRRAGGLGLNKLTKQQFCDLLNRREEVKRKRKFIKEYKTQEQVTEQFTSKFYKPWINNQKW
jgi:hypothetical protein